MRAKFSKPKKWTLWRNAQKRKIRGLGICPNKQIFSKTPDRGIFEKMASVYTLAMLAILRIVGSEAGQTALSVADSNGRKEKY
ncbi:MAG: hypothetical protein HDR21_13310 [Lachnospiraceae bacterium]|nr:hypothetical protein [Lachnospiraceae bacterium]